MTQQQNLAAQESNERSGKDNTENLIIAEKVTNQKLRNEFLYSRLRGQFINFENAIYDWMNRNVIGYQGGFWDFYTLSNQGFYMEPPHCYMLTSPNGFIDEVTPQEAGIIVTLMMLSHFSFVTYEKGLNDDCERISAYFHQLRDFIFTLPDVSQSKILRAID